MKNVSVLGACLLLAAACSGCSKPTAEEQKKQQEEQLATALSSAMITGASSATPPPSAVPAEGAPAAPPAVAATCIDTPAGACQEYLGFAPTMAETYCGYSQTAKFAKTTTPCSRDGLIGTCVLKDGPLTDIRYRYKKKGESAAAAAASAKLACDGLPGAWTQEAGAAVKAAKK
jgi:hypothetical protein